jgi:hypothetical protein
LHRERFFRCAANVTPAGRGVASLRLLSGRFADDTELGNGQGCFHPPVHRVPDDPVGVQVLIAHRYSFPSPVWCSVMSVSHSGFGAVALKSPLDEIIVDRRASLEPGPAPAVDHEKDAILRTQSPDPAFSGHRAVAGNRYPKAGPSGGDPRRR